MAKSIQHNVAYVACGSGCASAGGDARCSEGCIGCGACAKVCPQKVIHVHECANYIVVKCYYMKKGADAKMLCNVSCIGCGLCEKTCTAGAIKVKDNCAVIEESICLSCGMCAVKCPRHVIHDLHGILTEIR